MRMLRTKPMFWIFDIHFHMPENQDVNQGVLMWHAFFVKAVTAGYKRSVRELTPQTIISKIMHNSL